MYRVNVYDRYGIPLGELNRVTNVAPSYALSKSGANTFDVYVEDPKCTNDLIARDNIIVVWSDELEPWSGYITDESWSDDKLTVTCASIEQRFGRRRTDPHRYENQYPGAIFRYLVNNANKVSHTGISVGSVFDGGNRLTMEVVKDNIYDKLGELMDTAKLEYQVNMLVPGVWTISLAEKVGSDLTSQVVVMYGYDTEGTPEYHADNTQYVNIVTAIGKAPDSQSSSGGGGDSSAISDWEKRPKATYTDWDEVARFGIAEDTIEFNDISDKNTLMKLAREEVEKRKVPKLTVSFNLNRRRGLWSQFRDGDIIQCHFPGYGFGGVAVPVRVVGREIDYENDIMKVAGEVQQAQAAMGLSMLRQGVYNAELGYHRAPSAAELREDAPVTF